MGRFRYISNDFNRSQLVSLADLRLREVIRLARLGDLGQVHDAGAQVEQRGVDELPFP